jgi:dolichol-phosphate mannosyltransferase
MTSRVGGARATIVVPTLNEAANLDHLMSRIVAAMGNVEIVVVDDRSADGTAARARELAERYPVRVIERNERGLATAVMRGIRAARTDICVVMDADLSHPPERIPDMVEAVEHGAEVAIGSRYVAGGRIEGWPWRRRAISRAGTLIVRPLTPVRDPLTGFFCLRPRLLEAVELRPRGFKILLEILARARPTKVVEVPIRFEDRRGGTSKFTWRQRLQYLRQVWSLYWMRIRNGRPG